MLSPLVQGLAIGLSMILPIGAQNSHVLSHGIKRHHHYLAASICMVCDVLLIALGVFGGASLIARSPWLVQAISWGGILFLLSYAGMSFRRAWRGNYQQAQQKVTQGRKVAVVFTTLAITLLNPHVYLDTVMILGSVGGQFKGSEKLAFACGAMLASVIWFYSLASAAAKLSPWLDNAATQRLIDCLVGILMCLIAVMLYLSF